MQENIFYKTSNKIFEDLKHDSAFIPKYSKFNIEQNSVNVNFTILKQ